MASNFQQSQDEIAKYVKRFLSNRTAYHAPTYKEAQARQEFIDPMFDALGWDMRNAQGVSPDYREVMVEDSVEVDGQSRAPDYVFRVGRERKFFTEARKARYLDQDGYSTRSPTALLRLERQTPAIRSHRL